MKEVQKNKKATSPLEEAFRLLDKYNNTKSDNARERIVTQLFRAGYVIRPMQMIIIKDEVHADVLNEGSNEWGLYSRRTGRPVTRPGAGWKEATNNKEAEQWAFNAEFRALVEGGDICGAGAIKRQENGLYTVNNARNDGSKAIVPDVAEDHVEGMLQQLGIENSDWR